MTYVFNSVTNSLHQLDHAMRIIRKRYRKATTRSRQGVATVEFAIVLPVLIALTMGTMDVCSIYFLKESAVLAAYEGARQGVARGRTNDHVVSRITNFLDQRNIQYDANVVEFSSPGFTNAETLENVTVRVTIPTQGNLLIPSGILGDLRLTAEVTMRKEYGNLTN